MPASRALLPVEAGVIGRLCYIALQETSHRSARHGANVHTQHFGLVKKLTVCHDSTDRVDYSGCCGCLCAMTYCVPRACSKHFLTI